MSFFQFVFVIYFISSLANGSKLLDIGKLRTQLAGCNELAVAGINSTVISIEWSWPCLVENSTWAAGVHHYTYSAVAHPGGTDETKKGYCYDKLCREDIQNLRACVDYTIEFAAYKQENESFENVVYTGVGGKTLEEVTSEPQALITASKTSHSIELKWNPPRSHRECVHHYEVCYVLLPEDKNVEKNCSITDEVFPDAWGNEVRFTINGLEPCAEYQFTVKAFTPSGRASKAAVTISAATYENPSDPVRFRVISMKSKEATLCWNKPLVNPKCVESYPTNRVHCSGSRDQDFESYAETTATEADTTTEAVTTTTTTTTSTAPVTKTTASTTSTTTTTTTTEESIDSCDFYEVKGGLLSCTCYNFSLQAIGIGGTFLSNKLFFTSETELTDSDLLPPNFVEVEGISQNAATVSWFPPEEDYNCIDGYNVTWNNGKTLQWVRVSADQNTASISKLSPCTSYDVVVETLPSGTTTSSQPVSFTTADIAPGPATQLKVTEIGSSGFTMYWCNPMPDPQCAGYWDRDVTELEVQIPDLEDCIIDDTPDNINMETECQTYESSGLIPGQKYVFKLRALSPTNIPGETLRCIVETKP